MKDEKVIGVNPDEIYGAAKATQFLFVELAVALGYGEHFSKKAKDMERALMENGLVSLSDGSQTSTSEDFPYYYKGIRSSLLHISDLIDDKLGLGKPPENQAQLMPESATATADVEGA